jgi:hypothetical protein
MEHLIDWQRGERWLSQVFEFEPALRTALSKSPRIESAPGHSESILDELLSETYARILTAASEADFMPPCLKSFALKIAREVAGLPPDEDVERREEAELAALARVARALPDTTRQVFTLRKVYACSQEEIATRLKLSAAEVERHLIQAAIACTKGLFAGEFARERSRGPAGVTRLDS